MDEMLDRLERCYYCHQVHYTNSALDQKIHVCGECWKVMKNAIKQVKEQRNG